MLRTIVSVLALAGIVSTVTAPAFAAGGQTGTISGTVIDQTSKAPVAGARIGLAAPSGTYRGTTDAQGRFTINGVTVDTYTLTIESTGYDVAQQGGVTVTGDQVLNLGNITVSKTLKTIGRTTARAASSAFQPSQTTDSYTVGGQRAVEALGKADNFSENQLLLSVPGASTTDTGRVTIRGGLSNEVGYQLDGVPFTEPFFSTNASAGNFNGLGSLQVVEGAGDATQGNIGSGVVNVVPRRGTYPGTGLADFELGGPNFSHQFAIDYGIATRSGNISNYISYVGQRFVPYYGYASSAVSATGTPNYLGGSTLSYNDDLLDNFVLKFGKDNRQQLQVLYDTRDSQTYGQVGGLDGRSYFNSDPYTLLVNNPFSDVATYQKYVGLTPYSANPGDPTLRPIVNTFLPTHFLKFEYDNNLDSNTYLALRYYNSLAFNGANSTYSSSADPTVSITGGQRVGQSIEITRTAGSHNLTFQAQAENQKPVWNDYDPNTTLGTLGADGTSLGDFLPASLNGGTDGWVYSHVGFMRIPVVGINYNNTNFQTLGAGIRDQWEVNDKLKLDYGVRVDHANYKYGSNASLNPDLGNFSDVDPSFLRNQVLHPTQVEPRLAIALQPTRDDAFRVSYGRSVEFLNAQDAGTPGGIYGASQLANVPVTPGTNTTNPATWTCGSGLNTARVLPNKSNISAAGGGFFQCANYLQQLYWAYDQNNDAPDIGNGTSPTYDNYDASYAHQFKSGFAVKATGFYRRASGLPSFFVLKENVDPSTGQILSEVFSVNNNAISKTTGLELSLTTPEKPVGFSGFISATYQNSIGSVPPLVGGEDTLPLITAQSFQLGNTYRAGFLSPVSIDLGGTYRTRGGFHVTPTVQFNAGYPNGVGQYIAYNGLINGQAYNVSQTNLGGAAPTVSGFNGTTGRATATQFVDPAYPGSFLNPNIAATRGVKEGPSAGATLTNPSYIANISFEYELGKHNTIGLAINNINGAIYYGHTPVPNTYYQPVTTGVAGPQTGYPSQANPNNVLAPIYQPHGYAAIPASSYGSSPYILLPNNPTTYRLYYQLGL